MGDVYISVDIETDGPLPGVHSMLSIGAAVVVDGLLVSTFTRNLQRALGTVEDTDTATFWKKFPLQHQIATNEPKNINEVLESFAEWIKSVCLPNGRPVFVAWPANFDFAFVNHYFLKYWGTNPFGYSALDIKSYAMGINAYGPVPQSFSLTDDEKMDRKKFFPFENPMKHVALFDAIEQAYTFDALRRAAATFDAGDDE